MTQLIALSLLVGEEAEVVVLVVGAVNNLLTVVSVIESLLLIRLDDDDDVVLVELLLGLRSKLVKLVCWFDLLAFEDGVGVEVRVVDCCKE